MRRILIVEDDRFISTIFKMFLSELGHELVGRCEDGLQAIQMCKELKPDVILMDIHLHGELDGIQTAERLKMELDLPVIYISGDTSNTIIERAIVSNSYGYLVKPVNRKELGISIDLAYFKHKVDLEQKKRERGYREFISESPVPNIIIRNGKIQYLNKLALEQIMKTTYIEDVMGLPFERFVDEEYKEKVMKLLSGEGLNDDRFIDEYVKLKDLHGADIHAEISGSTVRFNNDMSLQIIVRDISPRVFQRRLSEFYQKALLDSGKPFLILDKECRLIAKNKEIHSLLPGIEVISMGDVVSVLQPEISRIKKENGLVSSKEFKINIENASMALKIYPICAGSGTICQWVITRD
ncbi:MAG: response regulator [Marinilabiliaceae bacterium]|nr:response regulator [Marinilabiliaceae bacterium]